MDTDGFMQHLAKAAEHRPDEGGRAPHDLSEKVRTLVSKAMRKSPRRSPRDRADNDFDGAVLALRRTLDKFSGSDVGVSLYDLIDLLPEKDWHGSEGHPAACRLFDRLKPVWKKQQTLYKNQIDSAFLEQMDVHMTELARLAEGARRPRAERVADDMLHSVIDAAIMTFETSVDDRTVNAICPLIVMLHVYRPDKNRSSLSDTPLGRVDPLMCVTEAELRDAAFACLVESGIEVPNPPLTKLVARLAVWAWLLDWAEAVADESAVDAAYSLIRAINEGRKPGQLDKAGNKQSSHIDHLRSVIEYADGADWIHRGHHEFRRWEWLRNYLDQPDHEIATRVLALETDLVEAGRSLPATIELPRLESAREFMSQLAEKVGELHPVIWASKLGYFMDGLLDPDARDEPAADRAGDCLQGLALRFDTLLDRIHAAEVPCPNTLTDSHQVLRDIFAGVDPKRPTGLFGPSTDAAYAALLPHLIDDLMRLTLDLVYRTPVRSDWLSPQTESRVLQLLLEKCRNLGEEEKILSTLTATCNAPANASEEETGQ